MLEMVLASSDNLACALTARMYKLLAHLVELQLYPLMVTGSTPVRFPNHSCDSRGPGYICDLSSTSKIPGGSARRRC